MLSKLRPRSAYDVFAVLAFMIAVGTGSAYAANTVFSTDIVDGEVKSVDIGNGEVGSADVKDNSLNTFDVHSFVGADVVDGSLEDQDIAQGQFIDFDATIETVFANSCKLNSVTGVGQATDHMVLTPTANISNGISYTAENDIGGAMWIKACNNTNFDIDDNTTGFNLLVIDAF